MEYNDFEFLQLLGSGGFGSVYLARYKDGNVFAIKELNLEKYSKILGTFNIRKVLKEIGMEIDVLKRLSTYPTCHPHIVCYYDDFKHDGNYYIVMEYIDGYTLDNILNIGDYLMDIVKQILETLIYIHQKGVAHSDIKPENLMLGKNDKNVYILDFGISCLKEECKGFYGTEKYMAPETKNYGIRTISSDIWSLGITIKVLNNDNNVLLEQLSNMMLTPVKDRPNATFLLNYLVNNPLYSYSKPTSEMIFVKSTIDNSTQSLTATEIVPDIGN